MKIEEFISEWKDDYRDEMRAFMDRINHKHVDGATGADGVATLKVILAAREAARGVA